MLPVRLYLGSTAGILPVTITCPACNAKYRHPGDEIVRTRNMQCGACEHEWEPIEHRITCDAPAIAPEMADLAPEETICTNLPVVIENVEPEELDLAPEPAPRLVRREAVPAATLSKTSIAAPMLALTLATLCAGSILFKEAVMAKIPSSVPYYQAAGLASQTPDLAIANVRTSTSKKDGIARLIVKGEVLNVADNTVPVPPLKLIMRGKADANLYAWTVTTTKSSLDAGEKSGFTAIALDIPEGAVNVDVEFDTSSAKTPAQ